MIHTARCGMVVLVGLLTGCAPQTARLERAEQDVRPPPPIYDPVPSAAPPEQPPWIVADSMLADDESYGLRYTRHVIVLHFHREATPAQRAAAVRALGGTVVGGLTTAFDASGPLGERGYVVWVSRARTLDQLHGSVERVQGLPAVANAMPFYLIPGPAPRPRPQR